nr:MAG TPA: hypothetical protein [Caudoviricetes sp.]
MVCSEDLRGVDLQPRRFFGVQVLLLTAQHDYCLR